MKVEVAVLGSPSLISPRFLWTLSNTSAIFNNATDEALSSTGLAPNAVVVANVVDDDEGDATISRK